MDYGYHSVEALSFLLGLKVKYSQWWCFQRNHESRQIAQVYVYDDWTSEKVRLFKQCGSALLISFTFLWLPPSTMMFSVWMPVQKVDDIKGFLQIQGQEVPHEGGMCNLLWSNPEERQWSWKCFCRHQCVWRRYCEKLTDDRYLKFRWKNRHIHASCKIYYTETRLGS